MEKPGKKDFPWMQIRDRLFNRLLAVDETKVLNPGEENLAGDIPPDRLASRLKLALDEIKNTGISGDGTSVDYRKLRSSRAYRDYRQSCSSMLQQFDPESLHTIEEKLAFWLNLYNALIIDAVIAFDVKTSVTAGRLGILRFFRQAAYGVCGRRLSCDDIEHGILRANRGHPYLPGDHFSDRDPRIAWVAPVFDSRIHFALNCGSRSCPPIQFYTPEDIDTHLDLAAKVYLNSQVTIDQRKGILWLPEIFKWYASDFGGKTGLEKLLIRYLANGEIRTRFQQNGGELRWKFKKFDWRLNM